MLNSLATLEWPSRVGDPGPELPGHSHPGGLTRSAGSWRLEPRGNQNSDGWREVTYIARELVIQINEVLGMKCQLRG